MKDFVRVMKALSDPNRVAIVKMLESKVMCVCEIVAALELAQPTVSKHLKVLEDAGLVASRKEGVWVNYHLSDGGQQPLCGGHFRQSEALARKGSARLAELLEKLPSIRREDICNR